MKVEVVTRREDLQALAGRWDQLALEDSRAGFFRTFVWYTAWIEHIRPDAEPFVVVREGDGPILGLAPLCRLRYRDLGYRLNGLAWAGRDVVSGDFLDFLTERSVRSEVVSAILTFLAGPSCRWS